MKRTVYNTPPDQINFKQSFDLSGQVIVITGGLGLLGCAFVEACAQHGAHVVIADIESLKPEKAAQVLTERHNREMLGVNIDVADRQSVNSLRDKVIDTFGKLDALVNSHQNKTASFFAKFEDCDDENWDAVVETNLKGTFLTCQILGSWMAEKGKGVIVNIPSTYSVVAPNQNLYKGTTEGCPAVYSASKGGIMAFSQYLSTYWADKGIRVNQLTPHGIIPYGEWDTGVDSFEERFSSLTPINRMSFNHEVCGALIFLLSDASSYVVGHNLIVDGGWTAW